MNQGSHILCCDITSLYTSIPIELGLEALAYWIGKYPTLISNRFTKAFMIESIKSILGNNYFTFDNDMYHQLIGAAMGSISAGPSACLTVGFLEETILFPKLSPSIFESDIVQKIKDL